MKFVVCSWEKIMKQTLLVPLSVLALSFITLSCVSSAPPQQTPRPTSPHNSQKKGPMTSNAIAESQKIHSIVAELNFIESSFLVQNCEAVQQHTQNLHDLARDLDITTTPPLVQASVYTCHAKIASTPPGQLKSIVAALKGLSLKYPIVNEPWMHSNLSQIYLALNDTTNALIEKKIARDLLLAQQQDVTSLNVEILKLDPSHPEAIAPSASSSSPLPQSVDQIISSATQLINNDAPDQAIALLDTIVPAQRNEYTKKIRLEAIDNLVTNLRFKVRALFVRSQEQTGPARKESLAQCEQILKGILKNYPEYPDLSAVQNNLKQVQREISKN